MTARSYTNRIAIRTLTFLFHGLLSLSTGLDVSAQAIDPSPTASAPLRDGFHFSIGAGTASVGASCPGCDVDFFSDRINGFSGSVQMGGAVTPKLVIAAEFMGWMKNEDPVYRRIAALNLVILGYPSATLGFFVKGGGGVLRAIAEDDFVRFQTDAYTAETGVGYDFPLSGRATLTPYATYLRTFGGETWFNGFVSPVVVTPNALQFGAALAFH